jgi:hypothetical protein
MRFSARIAAIPAAAAIVLLAAPSATSTFTVTRHAEPAAILASASVTNQMPGPSGILWD